MGTREYVGLLVVLLGCDPDVPNEVPYTLRIDLAGSADGGPLYGWELRNGDQVLGTVSRIGRIEFALPSTTRAKDMQLSLRRTTVCGEHEVPLPLEGAERASSDERIADLLERDGRMPLSAELLEPGVIPRPLFIDWNEQRGELRIGQQTLHPGLERAFALQGECGDSAAVTYEGEPIGRWSASDAATLISVDGTVCHELSAVGYGTATGGALDQVFGQRVRALERVPDFFLEPPASRVSGSTGGASRVQLQHAECPEPAWVARAAELLDSHGCNPAMNPLRRATQFDRRDRTSWKSYVRCLVSWRDEAKAIETARAALAHNPDVAELHAELVAIFEEGEMPNAITAIAAQAE